MEHKGLRALLSPIEHQGLRPTSGLSGSSIPTLAISVRSLSSFPSGSSLGSPDDASCHTCQFETLCIIILIRTVYIKSNGQYTQKRLPCK